MEAGGFCCFEKNGGKRMMMLLGCLLFPEGRQVDLVGRSLEDPFLVAVLFDGDNAYQFPPLQAQYCGPFSDDFACVIAVYRVRLVSRYREEFNSAVCFKAENFKLIVGQLKSTILPLLHVWFSSGFIMFSRRRSIPQAFAACEGINVRS